MLHGVYNKTHTNRRPTLNLCHTDDLGSNTTPNASNWPFRALLNTIQQLAWRWRLSLSVFECVWVCVRGLELHLAGGPHETIAGTLYIAFIIIIARITWCNRNVCVVWHAHHVYHITAYGLYPFCLRKTWVVRSFLRCWEGGLLNPLASTQEHKLCHVQEYNWNFSLYMYTYAHYRRVHVCVATRNVLFKYYFWETNLNVNATTATVQIGHVCTTAQTHVQGPRWVVCMYTHNICVVNRFRWWMGCQQSFNFGILATLECSSSLWNR